MLQRTQFIAQQTLVRVEVPGAQANRHRVLHGGAQRVLELGITGRDLLLDSGSGAREIAHLDFGDSTFRFAARPSTITSIEGLTGLRVATSYPGLVQAHLAGAGAHLTHP
mgnify:CR=1 FL=1